MSTKQKKTINLGRVCPCGCKDPAKPTKVGYVCSRHLEQYIGWAAAAMQQRVLDELAKSAKEADAFELGDVIRRAAKRIAKLKPTL